MTEHAEMSTVPEMHEACEPLVSSPMSKQNTRISNPWSLTVLCVLLYVTFTLTQVGLDQKRQQGREEGTALTLGLLLLQREL